MCVIRLLKFRYKDFNILSIKKKEKKENLTKNYDKDDNDYYSKKQTHLKRENK